MRFENTSAIICVLVLILLFCLEINALAMKKESFQLEIYPRKIDILTDSFSVIKLLPGVGSKKAKEIIELRKTVKSPNEIMNSIGLNKQQKDWEEMIQ
jgi:predicted nucleic acid-binding OB-fold protein